MIEEEEERDEERDEERVVEIVAERVVKIAEEMAEGTEVRKVKMFALIAEEKVIGKKVVWIDDENEF